MIDLLIINGLVLDGTGSPGFKAAVLVTGDQVRIQRGDVSNIESSRILDAEDRVLCRGFIDLHSHA